MSWSDFQLALSESHNVQHYDETGLGMAQRITAKLVFAQLQDHTCSIQNRRVERFGASNREKVRSPPMGI